MLNDALTPFLNIAINYWPLYSQINGQMEITPSAQRISFLLSQVWRLGGSGLWLIPAAFGIYFNQNKQTYLLASLALCYAIYPALSGQFFPYHYIPFVYLIILLASLSIPTLNSSTLATLSSFIFPSTEIPKIMTRLQSVADSAPNLDCPLLVMDTAPAAVLGANFDPTVMKRERKIIVNVGNFHTLAFRLGDGIEGVFEHHTGEIDLPKLENYIRALADGSLKHQDIFDDMGHGALVYGTNPFEFGKDEFDIVVTGPRRSLFSGGESRSAPALRPYFATPFGDMMIAGCFGLLAATAEVMPGLADPIFGSLRSGHGRGVATWDVSS